MGGGRRGEGRRGGRRHRVRGVLLRMESECAAVGRRAVDSHWSVVCRVSGRRRGRGRGPRVEPSITVAVEEECGGEHTVQAVWSAAESCSAASASERCPGVAQWGDESEGEPDGRRRSEPPLTELTELCLFLAASMASTGPRSRLLCHPTIASPASPLTLHTPLINTSLLTSHPPSRFQPHSFPLRFPSVFPFRHTLLHSLAQFFSLHLLPSPLSHYV